MGADFVFAVAVFKNWDTGYEEQNQLNERKDKLIKIIKEATPRQVDEYFENKGDSEVTGKDLTLVGKRNVIIKVIEDFFDCLNSREVGSFQLDGNRIYVSGGMSWGDPPTDSMDLIYDLFHLSSEILNRVDIE
jgi:hypothetical protein